MTATLDAIFDGQTLRPETRLDLKPNTRVRLSIEFIESDLQDALHEEKNVSDDPLFDMGAHDSSAPSDLSANHDTYLYGEAE